MAWRSRHPASHLQQIDPPRPILRDLDSLPFPAWDLVDISAYQQPGASGMAIIR